MTGRGSGPCGGARDPGYGHGRGFTHGGGQGKGRGMGHGPGRSLGWVALGYGREGVDSPGTSIRGALEARKAFLSAELARTDSLLAQVAKDEGGAAKK